MGGSGYQRLTAQDSSFLYFEGAGRNAHVTAVAVFGGGGGADGGEAAGGTLLSPETGLDIERAREHVASRLHLLPAYRRRLERTPLQGQPIWVDDDRFDIRLHVRRTRLPLPGEAAQLKELAAHVASVGLDPQRPLWELWFVEGLAGGRFAVVAKVHHSLVDGVSGVGVLTSLLSARPETGVAPVLPWSPRPTPGWLGFLGDGARDGVRRSLAAVRAVGETALAPRRAAGRTLEAAVSGWHTLSAAFDRPPATPFNGPIGAQRRLEWRALDLGELRDLRKRLEGSLNDVLLTLVAGAMRRWFKERRVRLRGSDLRVIVPVDTRAGPDDGDPANRVSAWFVTLPVAERDPLRRFARVRAQTRLRRRARAELAIDLFHRFADWTGSSTLTWLGASGVSLLRPYNLIVTNVPGPQVPLYLLDSELREIFPALPLFAGQGLAVAALSYRGRVFVGLTGDRDRVPDLHRLGECLDESLAELRGAAERRR